MKVIRRVRPMTAWVRGRRAAGATIGLVPTMGALHEGHRSLIRAASRTNDAVAVSIFVNPLQFGPREDFARYPRTLSQDLTVCKDEGVDVVFAPSVEELYPASFQTVVTVRKLTRRFEGSSRPGHFDGVTTVVNKLLHIIEPNHAFFGQKDYQQALVVRQMVKDLDLPVRVTICPTVREPNGLAMSSRNRFLSGRERKAAAAVFHALSVGRHMIQRGERVGTKVRTAMLRVIRSEPLAWPEYAAVVDADSLEDPRRLRGRVVLLLAVWIGKTRLIDNMVVTCR